VSAAGAKQAPPPQAVIFMPTVVCRPLGGLNDMLNQVERCREYAAQHRYRLIVDTQGCAGSCLPLPFGRVFQLQNCGCVALTSLSTDEQSLLNRMETWPAKFEGIMHKRVPREPLPIDFGAPPSAPLMVHMMNGGGTRSHKLIKRRQLSVSPAFLADHAVRWQALVRGVRSLGAYEAVHIRHTDYKTPGYAALLESVFADEGVSCALVCSDNAGVLEEAGQIAARHGKRMVSAAALERPTGVIEGTPSLRLGSLATPSLRSASLHEPEATLLRCIGDPCSGSKHPHEEPGGAPTSVAAAKALHQQARKFKSEEAETYALELLRDLYALSHATRLHLSAPEGRSLPAGFSLLAKCLQSNPGDRDAFFGEAGWKDAEEG
jgi:hypothetical protein